MRRVLWLAAVLLAGPGLTGDGALAAQELAAADRAPRFFFASPAGGGLRDARNAPVLRQRIAVDLDQVPLADALETISARAHLRLLYAKDLLPADARVSLRASDITIIAALTEVLLDSGLDVVLSPRGQMTLVRRVVEDAPIAPGTLAGRVTDAKTGGGLVGAEVWLEGTRRRTATGDNGFYRLTEVEAGSYTLNVRRIGYGKRSRPVTVVAEQEVTVDVALDPVPTHLQEVVTTMTGERRLLELGHVVGRINADSVVKEAPVSTLSELLNGRVPGLQVFTASGQVGGQVSLRIRTLNSINLNTEPIVIVDGVRYTSGLAATAIFGAEPTSRLNDLNPNDLESIEVVKGPAAAALYGTDAANGVIVITTKRGQPGPARWGVYARASRNEVPVQHFPGAWWGWQSQNGVPSLTRNCYLQAVISGECTQDSVTVLPNVLNDARHTPFAGKPRWEYGATLAGGRPEVHYHASVNFERAVGPVGMPPVVAESLAARRGTRVPDEQLEPNALTKLNLRANVTMALGPTADLRLNSDYGHSATRTLTQGAARPYNAWAKPTPTDPYGGPGRNPSEVFALTSTDVVDRFGGSVTGTWRPWARLEASGTVGFDLATSNGASLVRRGESISFRDGVAADNRTRQLATTGNLRVTALAQWGRLSLRTAVGAQYTRSVTNALSTIGRGLPPGGESVGQAANRSVEQGYDETATLGSYVEETLGLNDRLFVTGALRVDGASAFGRDYDAALYPKVGASWLLSEEPFVPRLPGLDELRLRYAFGASGQQATSRMTLPTFGLHQAIVDGTVGNAIGLGGLGNPNLRPERTRDHDVGLDATGLGGRLTLGLTWFRRTTHDQILLAPLAPGYGSIHTNLGLTTGHGFEAELTARLIDTPRLSWQVTLQHSLSRSRLEKLGDAEPNLTVVGGHVEGYPLGARFEPPLLGYADTNGDGLIGADEIQVGSEKVYMGEGTPPVTQTLTTTVGLFRQRLRLTALVERRSGFTQIDGLASAQCGNGLCRALVDPRTPLADQARYLANFWFSTYSPFIVPGDFTRLREVTLALELPAGLLRRARLRSAQLSIAARNLALWKSFSGPDPESAAVRGTRGGFAEGIPQGRSWVLRLDLGL